MNRKSMKKVLAALLDAHEAGELLSGVGVMRVTGKGGGTVFPILRRLEDDGWIRGEWEHEHPPPPPRRLYSLTLLGEDEARDLLGR